MYTELGRTYLGFAENALTENRVDHAKHHLTTARANSSDTPSLNGNETENSALMNAWKEAVGDFNSRLPRYRERGISIDSISIG